MTLILVFKRQRQAGRYELEGSLASIVSNSE